MNIDDIPTPLTDAAEHEAFVHDYGDEISEQVVKSELARALERRLAACQATLKIVRDASSSTRLRRIAKETLTLTAPKP